MARGIRVVWLLQGLLLSGVALLSILDPPHLAPLLPSLQSVDSPLEIQVVELFAPLLFGLGLLTLMLLRPAFAWLTQPLANAFFLWWALVWVVGVMHGASEKALALAFVLAGVNLIHGRSRPRAETPASARAKADAEAPVLGRVWLAQMIYFGVVGVVLIARPQDVAGAVFLGSTYLDTWVFGHVLPLAGTAYLGLALISQYAAGAQSDATWRGFCAAFLAAEAGASAVLLANLDFTTVGPWVLALILPLVAFAIINGCTLYDRRWIRRRLADIRAQIGPVWALQLVVLVVVAVMLWFLPNSVLLGMIPGGGDFDEKAPLVAFGLDVASMIGPMAAATAALTWMGLMRADRRGRYAFNRILAAWFLTWAAVGYVNGAFVQSHEYPLYFAINLAIGVPSLLLAVVHGVLTLVPDWSETDALYEGVADSKPWWVWGLFMAFALGFAALAFAALFHPQHAAHAVMRPELLDGVAIPPVILGKIRGTAPYWMTFAFACSYAAWAPEDWAWRGMGKWLIGGVVLYAASYVYMYDTDIYRGSGLIGPGVMMLGALVMLYAVRLPQSVADVAGQPPPQGWLLADAGAGIPQVSRTRWRGFRASHGVGVASTGTLRCQVAPELPSAAFFRPAGGELAAVARFSNARALDDAALDARGCSLRLQRPGALDDAIDLLLRTGSYHPHRHALEIALWRWTPEWLRRRRLRADHAAREAAFVGLRRAPERFDGLCYYSQVVRNWVERRADGSEHTWHCRFRLIPEDGVYETGFPTAADALKPWEPARSPGEPRPSNYLRADFVDRVRGGGVEMVLQVQLSAEAGGSELDEPGAWYDATVDWDEVRHPWRTLGRLSLDEVLPDASADALCFDPSGGGDFLVTPPAMDWRDPRSVATAQERVMRLVARYRIARARRTAPRGEVA